MSSEGEQHRPPGQPPGDAPGPLDRSGRPLRSLRISVTDRCNLRCGYCMPEEEYAWLPRSHILRFEEIATLVDAFCDVGVRRLRLTGGEPLLRRDLWQLVELLAAKSRVEDLALTTNAVLLGDQAAALRAAGLQRITVSLDTLRADRFRQLTRRDELARALAGIEAAQAVGFTGIKLNTVVMRGANDDELLELLEFARAGGHEARFIEYMDVGGATEWSMEQVVPRAEILERVSAHFGPATPVVRSGAQRAAPAERFRLEDGTVFGIIASTTAPFCGACDRARLTADGHWFLCLYAQRGIDVGAALRGGEGRAQLAARLARVWGDRTDRGAERRLGVAQRTALAEAHELAADPHREMHTRGG